MRYEPRVRSLWVAELRISERTAAKIRGKHHVDPEDVRVALVGVQRLQYVWDDDKERGSRAIVSLRLRGRSALAVLYDAADPLGDVWHLGSVYFVDV